MKLIRFILEKIGHGDNTCEFLPEDTQPGQTIIIKKDDPDYSGAYRVLDKSSFGRDETIIINQQDIIT